MNELRKAAEAFVALYENERLGRRSGTFIALKHAVRRLPSPPAAVAVGEQWRHTRTTAVCDVIKICDGRVYVKRVGDYRITWGYKEATFLEFFKREETQRGVYIGLKS